VQRANEHHATDDVLELYAMNRLSGPELDRLEEHLLICQSCQDRLAAEESIRDGVRAGGAALEDMREQPRWRWPKLGWGLGLAAAAMLVLAIGFESGLRPTVGTAPAEILLAASRGGEDAAAAVPKAGQPLAVILDLQGLPQLPEYKLEVVDAGGKPVVRSNHVSQNNQLRASLEKGLQAGAYFVRVYAVSGELLREYALRVRD